MIIKPERIIKRIIKAVGERQSVLVIGNWEEELIKELKAKQNSITQISDVGGRIAELTDNSFTRIIAECNLFGNPKQFFCEVRRLLLPTGYVVITANSEIGILDKILGIVMGKKFAEDSNTRKIKPKFLQDLVHEHGFLIDAYNGYPGGHLLMIAQIQDKEVSTLFSSQKQETLHK